LVLNKDRVRTEVLDTQLALANFTTKDFVSPSLLSAVACAIKGKVVCTREQFMGQCSSSTYQRKTGEVYASKDIERYSGYTDGESWSEGSNWRSLIYVVSQRNLSFKHHPNMKALRMLP
jgi:hypothetical protein